MMSALNTCMICPCSSTSTSPQKKGPIISTFTYYQGKQRTPFMYSFQFSPKLSIPVPVPENSIQTVFQNWGHETMAPLLSSLEMSVIFLLSTLALKLWQRSIFSVSSQILSARMKYFLSTEVESRTQQTFSSSKRQEQGGSTVKQKYLEKTKYRTFIRQSSKNQEKSSISLSDLHLVNSGSLSYYRYDATCRQFRNFLASCFLRALCTLFRKLEEKQTSLNLGLESYRLLEGVMQRRKQLITLVYSKFLVHFSSFLSNRMELSESCPPLMGVLISPAQLGCACRTLSKYSWKSCLCFRKMTLVVGSLAKMYLIKVLTSCGSTRENCWLTSRLRMKTNLPCLVTQGQWRQQLAIWSLKMHVVIIRCLFLKQLVVRYGYRYRHASLLNYFSWVNMIDCSIDLETKMHFCMSQALFMALSVYLSGQGIADWVLPAGLYSLASTLLLLEFRQSLMF